MQEDRPMTTLPTPGTDELKTDFWKGYLILACIGMAPIVGGIIIKLTGGELDYQFWFGTLCSFAAVLLGLVIISKYKKQLHSEKTNKEQEKN